MNKTFKVSKNQKIKKKYRINEDNHAGYTLHQDDDDPTLYALFKDDIPILVIEIDWDCDIEDYRFPFEIIAYIASSGDNIKVVNKGTDEFKYLEDSKAE